MRLFLAAAVFGLCTFYGFSASSDLKKRVQLLSELSQMTAGMALEIGYTAPTLDELAQGCRGAFAQLLRQELSETDDIHAAWSAATKRLSGYGFCGDEEAELLLKMGAGLGTSDAEGQLSMLSMYREQLSQLKTDAEERFRVKGKLMRSVGTLLGAGIAVLIV